MYMRRGYVRGWVCRHLPYHSGDRRRGAQGPTGLSCIGYEATALQSVSLCRGVSHRTWASVLHDGHRCPDWRVALSGKGEEEGAVGTLPHLVKWFDDQVTDAAGRAEGNRLKKLADQLQSEGRPDEAMLVHEEQKLLFGSRFLLLLAVYDDICTGRKAGPG
jgi:hypothetical protein